MSSYPNVVSLRRPPRPTRANSVRAPEYMVKHQRETEHRQMLVSRMEEALFCGRGRTRSGRGIPFLKEEIEFDAGVGLIYYFFAESQGQYVLIDFIIHEGGGGGQPCALRIRAGYRPGTGWNRAIRRARSAARVAACAVRRIAQMALRIALVRIAPVRLPMISSWLGKVRSVNQATLREMNLLRLVIRSGQSDLHPACLPEWSLLRRFVVTPEQLDNVYARSILAGEALSRLGGEADLALFVTPHHGWSKKHRDVGLLEECNTLIDALFGDRAAARPRRRLRHFATSFLVDGNLLADDRRLRLIKSEMTLLFAASLARNATALRSRMEQDLIDPGDRGRCADLMHRCARLTDFVRLSNRYLGGHSHGHEESIVDELDGFDRRARSQLACLVSGLSEFSSSSGILVCLLTSGDDERPAKPQAMAEIQARLRSLASEILDPGP
jgi:hypothetical protein